MNELPLMRAVELARCSTNEQAWVRAMHTGEIHHGAASMPATPTSAAGRDGKADDVARRKLTDAQKREIAKEARHAAKNGMHRMGACSYHYDSNAGQEWLAVYLLAGGEHP